MLGNLRTAWTLAIGVAVASAFGTFGLTLSAIPPIIGSWITTMTALWAAYQGFFGSMAAAFDDVEPTATQIAHLDAVGVIPSPPALINVAGRWKIKLGD